MPIASYHALFNYFSTFHIPLLSSIHHYIKEDWHMPIASFHALFNYFSRSNSAHSTVLNYREDYI